jgi:hypothetical protein
MQTAALSPSLALAELEAPLSRPWAFLLPIEPGTVPQTHGLLLVWGDVSESVTPMRQIRKDEARGGITCPGSDGRLGSPPFLGHQPCVWTSENSTYHHTYDSLFPVIGACPSPIILVKGPPDHSDTPVQTHMHTMTHTHTHTDTYEDNTHIHMYTYEHTRTHT